MKNEIINAAGKAWNKLDFPVLGSLRFNILVGVYHLFPLIGGIDYSRLAEWRFVLKHLPPPPARVLDVGSTTSLFPFKLKSLGYKTHCLDQRLPNFRIPKPIIFHRDNLMTLSIKSDTYDAVSCISTVEHIGMGKYSDPKSSKDGDIIAIKEMLRILKQTGRLIITTNICRQTCVYYDEIRYGKDRLYKLMSLGKLIAVEYRYFNGRRWLVCNEKKAFERDANHFGISMFVLTKV